LSRVENQGNPFSLLLYRWEELKRILNPVFEKREFNKAQPLMEEAMLIFQELLVLTNGEDLSDLNQLKWKPVNLADRLLFIKKRINSYHAFIQLSELFIEQEKLYQKSLVIKK
jgi:hypothetical protein